MRDGISYFVVLKKPRLNFNLTLIDFRIIVK